jgi:hypothetical protein
MAATTVAPTTISPGGPEGAGAKLASGPEVATARGSLGVARPPSAEIGRRQPPDGPILLSPAGKDATVRLEAAARDKGDGSTESMPVSPENTGTSSASAGASSGEQAAPDAVDTAIVAVTAALGREQQPQAGSRVPEPDVVVPSDVLNRDPDFYKKVDTAKDAAAAKGQKITDNQARTQLLNEHYQAWAKDQGNVRNFLKLFLTEGSFRKIFREKERAVSAARQMGETVSDSSVVMALAEWRQGKDKVLDEQRKKGEPTGVIGFIYRILNKFFNKFVKGAALFAFQTAEHDIVPGLKGPQQR